MSEWAGGKRTSDMDPDLFWSVVSTLTKLWIGFVFVFGFTLCAVLIASKEKRRQPGAQADDV